MSSKWKNPEDGDKYYSPRKGEATIIKVALVYSLYNTVK